MQKQKKDRSALTRQLARNRKKQRITGVESYNKASREKAEKLEEVMPQFEYYYNEYDEYLSS